MHRPALTTQRPSRARRETNRFGNPSRITKATLAALAVLALAGCSTPVLKSAVDVPPQFAAAATATTTATATAVSEPEVAWWESYGDPVLSELIRRAARENRDIKMAAQRVRAARAGETISRSRLMPSIGLSAGGDRSQQRLQRRGQARLHGQQDRQRRARRLLGDRHRRRIAGRRGGRGSRNDGRRARRARRALARAERRRDQLLHPHRCPAPARHRACDLRRAGRNAAPGHCAPARPALPRRSTSSGRRPKRRAHAPRFRRWRRWRRCHAIASRC